MSLLHLRNTCCPPWEAAGGLLINWVAAWAFSSQGSLAGSEANLPEARRDAAAAASSWGRVTSCRISAPPRQPSRKATRSPALQVDLRGDANPSHCDDSLANFSLELAWENTTNLCSAPEQLQLDCNGSCRCLEDKLHSCLLTFEASLSKEELNEGIIDKARVKARVQHVSTTITHDLVFMLSPHEVPKERDPRVKGTMSHVRLPRGLFRSIPNRTNYVKVAVMVLNVGQMGLFKPDGAHGNSANVPQDPKQPGTMVDNVLVSLKVGSKPIASLHDCVELTFVHRLLSLNTARQCVFWDTKKGPHGGWNTSGCLTDHRDRETVCCCDHLTFFTLLLVPSLDKVTAQMLFTIANVSCGISLVSSVLIVGLYFALRFAYKKFKSNNVVKIHVNLMSSLLLLNLAYLLNGWIFSLGHQGLCKGIGGFTHYCLLCCFTWMAIEAFQLYLLTIKVTNIYIRHYLVKLCLIGWGFPALVVTITGSMNSYGKYTVTDAANQTTVALCWIDTAHLAVHYVTNCSYFGLIFLVNSLVLGVVAWKLFSLHRTRAGREEKREAWKRGLTLLGLACLLGATWGLAFLTYGTMSVPALYLFTVLNSLQGLFIFIWFTVLYYPRKGTPTPSSGGGRDGKGTTASHGQL
ncbi:adhesion G protein-coupled receptor G3 [Carettochelys insculpta]|uniref:adhesion G protein-coupled receptor G3 n=1 Tax=Carettochelys insculpta TaxID=44489 RepID=UPI003EBE08EE